MKLTALHIARFGVWRNLALDALSPGINVFFGRNEAGKTTLLDFTRGLLFGYSGERQQRYNGVAREETWGGAAHLTDGAHQWLWERLGEAEPRVTRLCADGAEVSAAPAVWSRTLESVDAATFERVFAVGLREMQELGTLQDSQAGSLLYELSCGAEGRAVARALADVRETRMSLTGPDAGSSQLGQLRAQRNRLRAALARSRAEFAQFDKRGKRLAALDERIAALERDLAGWRADAQRFEAAHGLRETWAALTALPHADEAPAAVSAEALLEFEELSRRGRRARRAWRQATEQWAKHRAKRAALASPKAPAAEAIRRANLLLEQHDSLLWTERQVAVLRDELRALQAAIPAPVVAAPATPALTPEQARRVRIAGRRLFEARAAEEQARRDAATAKRQHATLAEELQRSLQGRNSADVVRAIEHAGQNVNQAKRRLQLDERLTRMERQRGELEEQTRELLDRQVLGYWTLGWLGGLFIFGVVMILAGLFLPRSVTGAAGWWLAALGVAGIGVAVAARHLMEQSAENQLDACRAQVNLLNRQLDQSRRERDELDAQLPADGGPITRRVDHAEEELARYENLLPLEGRSRTAEQAAASAEENAQEARATLDSAQSAWREALRLANLAQDMAPADARALLRTLTAPAPAAPGPPTGHDRAARLEAELQLREREAEHNAGRVAAALADWGLPPAGALLAARLDQLSAARAAWLARRSERRRWVRMARKLRRRRRQWRLRGRRLATRRRRLLLAAGVATPEQFRALAARWSEAARIAASREQLRRQIKLACAGIALPEAIEELLHTQAAVEIERKLAELRIQIEQGQRELHERRAERSQLAGDAYGAGDHEQTRLELAMVTQRLKHAIERARVMALTEAALAAQLRRYERECQPLTLRQASRYLERMTEGRYVKVWTPVEHAELRIDSADGRTLPVAALSRGTREQLYLALRMAIVDDYARRGIELPLVLDDVLVNFDDQRARRAAETLVEYAATGRQVFVLTCHEHIAAAFDDAGAPVRDLGAEGRPWRLRAPIRAEVRQELPPPLPEVARPARPVVEPVRERTPRNVASARRPRRRVLHTLPLGDVLPRPVAPLVVPAPSPSSRSVVFQRRRMLRWDPWSQPNGAEDFAGEFNERVFS